jgi:hypothetical protein
MAKNKLNAFNRFSMAAEKLRGQAVDCHSGQCVISQMEYFSIDIESAG